MDESTQLPELLEVLRSFTPTIPEELVDFYLQQAGFSNTDPRLCVPISRARALRIS